MSSRDATLTINNNTGYALTNMGNATATDGQFASKPASSISSGSSSTFKVTKTSDAAAHGPEGYLDYLITMGATPAQTVRFEWDHPNDSNPSRYWVDTPAGVNASTNPASPSGHDQTVSYTVTTSPGTLRGYDIVTALGETLLSSQLQYLYNYGVFPHAISGTSGSDRLDITSMRQAPQLTLPNVANTVDIKVHVNKGTLTTGGATIPVDGCDFVVRANLSLAAGTQASMDADTAATATQFAGQGFTIYQLFTDFTNPSSSVLMSVTGVTLTAAQATAFGNCLGAYAATRPRWCLAVSAQAANPSQLNAADMLPGFVPVSCELSTTYADPKNGQSSVNLLMMTQGHTRWGDASRTRFSSPLLPALDASSTNRYATMMIARDQLAAAYIQAALLPVIQSGVQSKTAFKRSGLDVRWTLSDYHDDSAQNDGKGVKTAVDNDFDYYTVTRLTTWVDLRLADTKNGTLTLSGSGYFDQDVTTKQYPLFGVGPSVLLGEVEYRQNFTLTVTLSPGELTIQYGDDGKSVTNQAGQLLGEGQVVEGTLDKVKEDEGFLQSFADFCNSLFLGDDESFSEHMSNQYENFAKSLMSGLDDVATHDIGTATTYLVFPSGPLFDYSGLRLDGSNNLQVDLLYHG